VGIITKGALVRRDVALLGELAKVARLHVNMSIAFASDELARKVEPYANRPSNRFEAMRRLADAGVSTGVMVAPIIPGLNDVDIPELLERARDAGARRASMTLLRLPAEVRPVFEERIAEHFPDRARKIRNGILAVKNGTLNRSAFGERFEGTGARWEAIRSLFQLHCQRLGLRGEELPSELEPETTFRRPEKQRRLFEL
jgi:DNA repair photolyase